MVASPIEPESSEILAGLKVAMNNMQTQVPSACPGLAGVALPFLRIPTRWKQQDQLCADERTQPDSQGE